MYNIADKLFAKAGTDVKQFEALKRDLAEHCNVDIFTVVRWFQITNDTQFNKLKGYGNSISSDNLKAVANYFNCKVKDLYNE